MLEKKLLIQVYEVMELVAEQQDLSEEVLSAFQSSDFDIDELRNELHGIDELHGMEMDEVKMPIFSCYVAELLITKC